MSAVSSRGPASAAGRRWHRWLAILPSVGMLGGVPFVNRVHPIVLGLPLFVAWLVAWVLITAMVMGCILWLDGAPARPAASPAAPDAATEAR